MADQPPEVDDLSPTASLLRGEDKPALRVRQYVMGNIRRAVPLWLVSNSGTSLADFLQGRAASVWSEYKRLSRTLHCFAPADKIRWVQA